MERRYYNHGFLSQVFDVISVIFLSLFCFVVIYPFWNQFVMSISNGLEVMKGNIYFLPRKMTLASYSLLFDDTKFLPATAISILRVVVGTVTCLLCAGLLSYITTVRYFSGRKLLRRIFVFTMYFGGGLIPTYLLMVQLKLINTFTVYWLPGLLNAYYMLLISSYMQNIPEALLEAARMDGARELSIYFRIMLPICKPVFAAVSVYVTVGHWNSWFDCMIYNPSGKWDTLQVYLRRILLEAESFTKIMDQSVAASKYRNMTPQTLRAATTVVVTLPILFVYPFFQKYFISGITIGSVKE